MKKTIFYLFLLLCSCFESSLFSQTTRYFQFKTFCGGDDWRDTSFVAAATNADLIAEVLNEMERPFEERKFILGDIAAGDGGFNFNGDHWFNWHFVIDEWQLAEVSVEVCDGCPFSNVEKESEYWLTNVGFFCPWSSKPVREIIISDTQGPKEEADINIYPNPAREKIYFDLPMGEEVKVELRNIIHTQLRYFPKIKNGVIEVFDYPPGLYVLSFKTEHGITSKKVVIAN